MFETKKILQTFCFTLILCLTGSGMFAQKLTFGYYPTWAENKLPAGEVKFDKLTHVVHAFIYPDSNGVLVGTEDLTKSDLVTQAHNSGTKVLVSLGGAPGELVNPSKWFNDVAADDTKLATFTDALVNFITQNNYDGVDIDWEQPENLDQGKNLTKMVKAIKEKFTQINKPLLITMATFPSEFYHSRYEYDKLAQDVDYFLVMAYNYTGSWLSYTGHNTPLYTAASPYDSNGSVDQTLNRLIELGIPKEKLVMGTAFYGWQYSASELRGTYTGTISSLLYHEIDALLQTGNWQVKWDDETKNSYAVDTQNNKFITFDDTISIRHKAEYVLNNNYAGIMIWALSYDVLADKSQPLVDAINKVLYTSVEESKEEITGYKLSNNYPNPFNPSTVISFEIPEKSYVELKIFNLTGEEIETIFSGELEAGKYERRFNGANLASGVYFYRLTSGSVSISQKMVLLK